MPGNENKPSASVTTSRLNPVSVWVAVTVAPGRTPPLESLTVPVICAVAWASAAVAVRARRRAPHNEQIRARFIASLPGGRSEERESEAVATTRELYTSERGRAQEAFDQGLVRLPAAHLCVPAGRADDVKPYCR